MKAFSFPFRRILGTVIVLTFLIAVAEASDSSTARYSNYTVDLTEWSI